MTCLPKVEITENKLPKSFPPEAKHVLQRRSAGYPNGTSSPVRCHQKAIEIKIFCVMHSEKTRRTAFQLIRISIFEARRRLQSTRSDSLNYNVGSECKSIDTSELMKVPTALT